MAFFLQPVGDIEAMTPVLAPDLRIDAKLMWNSNYCCKYFISLGIVKLLQLLWSHTYLLQYTPITLESNLLTPNYSNYFGVTRIYSNLLHLFQSLT